MNHVSKPQFLLIQNDNVLGVSPTPKNLPYKILNQAQTWLIVIGTVNEFDQPEVVGTVAEAYPRHGKPCYRVSSPLDGNGRLVGSAMSIIGLITERLRVLYGNGCYQDLCQLPPAIVVTGCDSGAPKKKAKKSA